MSNYYERIKELVIDTESTIKVKDYIKNKTILNNNYKIGNLIVESQGGIEKAKYGNKLIKEYAKKLTNDLGKGYSWRNLYNMRSYYIMFTSNEILQTLSAKLDWSYYVELLKLKDIYAVKYYIETTYNKGNGVRELRERIKSNEYERLPDDTKEKLKNKQELELKETITDPIIIPNPNKNNIILEKELQKLIMENISLFLRRLGTNYMFVGNEYSIKIGTRTYKIDLLLYNKDYNSYVVIELKVGEFKKEYISQIETYMNYVDTNIKNLSDNKTIGIILCQRNNKLLVEYCSRPDVIVREYVLK